MPNTPLRYRPNAVATPIGWAHELTGEQLVSARNLDPDTGTETYNPNSKNWMRTYQNGPASPTPNSFTSLNISTDGLTVTVSGSVRFPGRGDDVAIDWGVPEENVSVSPNEYGNFTSSFTYAAAGEYGVDVELGDYTPDVLFEFTVNATEPEGEGEPLIPPEGEGT